MSPTIKIAGMKIFFTSRIVPVAFLLTSVLQKGYGQLSAGAIDSLVARTSAAFDVPGLAVGVVKDGKILYSKGYGVRSMRTKEPVDENTVFGIASNSKAFTATAIGILVDEGKLQWDDQVKKFIPEFQLYNPSVSDACTIRDLLAHHSGLDQNAGDLMHFPDSADFTTKDVIYNMRFLKPVSGFRTNLCYSNNLYAVAGEIIARVSGMSYDQFIEQRIMKPLGMTHSAACYERLQDHGDVIDGHRFVDGEIQVIPRVTLKAAHPAGGIYSSLGDMEKWVSMLLADGRFGDGEGNRLLSSAAHHELWSPQTILPVGGPGPYNTRMAAYGMGFEIYDIVGDNLQIRHTGGIDGMVSMVTMIPGLHLGIIVLTNAEEPHAFYAITNTIKDSYLGIHGMDRVEENRRQVNSSRTAEKKFSDSLSDFLLSRRGRSGHSLTTFVGAYRDNWLGQVTIRLKDGCLWFAAKRSPQLRGELWYDHDRCFVARWENRRLKADAYVNFQSDESGHVTGFTMKAVSPNGDMSYDFQDLLFKKARLHME
jgi:CubicO group peptidase (beta-lactamase class C family)